MVTMDMGASQLLNPLIIFSGELGGHLMKKWSSYKNSLVLFTKNHWQTSFTVVTYLEYLRKRLYPSKKCIGLIWDKASSHCSDMVLKYIEESNKDTEIPKLVVETVDAGLTSIYQPPDVVVNKPLKVQIRRKYEDLISKRGKFVPGKRQEISKEELVQIVEESYHEINSRNRTDQYIKNAFEMFGLNPWGKPNQLSTNI